MKLLIAEDDLTSRTMLAAVTRKWGYEPIAVEDGEAAWQVMQEDEAPRLLLLDWEMPKLDGLALCQRIRQQQSSNPPFIILLTARCETGDIVAGLDAGANDYIAKPFENAELQARLQVGRRMLTLQQELLGAKDALAFQATHDALTGLLNRGAVMQVLEKEMARAIRLSQPLCIGLCDIDYFKRIVGALRPYDQVGRYGGEEFLILLNAKQDQAQNLLERIRRAMADTPIVIEQAKLEVTISCGATLFVPPEDKRGGDALLTIADAALYESKAAGRNCTVFSPPPFAAHP